MIAELKEMLIPFIFWPRCCFPGTLDELGDKNE